MFLAEVRVHHCELYFLAGEAGVEVGCVFFSAQLGLEGCFNLLSHELVEIDGLEEGVLADSLGILIATSHSLLRVPLEQLENEVLGGVRYLYLRREAYRVLQDLLVHLGGVFRIERRSAVCHLVDEDAETPPVYILAIALIVNNLRSKVLGGTAEGIGFGIGGHLFLNETKICQANVAIEVQEDVLRLEISVHDSLRVKVLEGSNHLSSIEPDLLQGEPSLLLKMSKQITSVHVVENQVQLLWALESKLEADHEGMGHLSQHFVFGLRTFDLVSPDKHLLVQNLHSIQLASGLHLYKHNLAKSTTSNYL
mmetsp:Transcript_46168/g.118971  ORF Transcript_46168/g.118971 Transcript_46168/m.118971 type:complete len:309 (-) Transcript_46168:476-1402(-)